MYTYVYLCACMYYICKLKFTHISYLYIYIYACMYAWPYTYVGIRLFWGVAFLVFFYVCCMHETAFLSFLDKEGMAMRVAEIRWDGREALKSEKWMNQRKTYQTSTKRIEKIKKSGRKRDGGSDGMDGRPKILETKEIKEQTTLHYNISRTYSEKIQMVHGRGIS